MVLHFITPTAIIFHLFCISNISCLHLKGTWESSEFFLFLSRFGFQKTDPGKLDDTQGFIYGKITSNTNNKLHDSYYTLVLVDSEYFMEFYGNQTLRNSVACNKMFNKIDTVAYYPVCQYYGLQDFIRRVPCPKGHHCIDEDTPSNVLDGYQFTYRVQNKVNPRFWYLSMVACHRKLEKKDCNWHRNTSMSISLDYDIWLVNGDPASKHLNPFEHQFSFEMHDVFEIYAIFLILYMFTLPTWIYAYRQQKHKITTLLTVCISMEFMGVVFNFLHVLIFSFNGVGAEWIKVLGNLLGTLAECLFMLLLLFIAKGWTIIDMKLSSRKAVFGFWAVYTGLNALFFIISLTQINIITNIDEWNSWPGYLIVSFRLIIMVWFVLELRSTVRYSKHESRLDFFQQFAAYYLVWFVYLPILVIVATQISHLWRYKTILSITYAADLLSYIVLIHLLWPSRSVLYLIKGDTPLPEYDLQATGLMEDDSEDTVYMKSPTKSQGTKLSEMIGMKETSLGGRANGTSSLVGGANKISRPTHNGGVTNGHVYTSISLSDVDEEEDFEIL